MELDYLQWRDQKGTGVVQVSGETESRRGIQKPPCGPFLFSGLLCDPSCQFWGYRHCAEDLKYISLVSHSRAHLCFTEVGNLRDWPQIMWLISGRVENHAFLTPKSSVHNPHIILSWRGGAGSAPVPSEAKLMKVSVSPPSC